MRLRHSKHSLELELISLHLLWNGILGIKAAAEQAALTALPGFDLLGSFSTCMAEKIQKNVQMQLNIAAAPRAPLELPCWERPGDGDLFLALQDSHLGAEKAGLEVL